MIYSLTGRINTETASAVDKQIDEAIKQSKTPVDRLILDCSQLEYIASSGLRVVLKYKKLYPDLEFMTDCELACKMTD